MKRIYYIVPLSVIILTALYFFIFSPNYLVYSPLNKTIKTGLGFEVTPEAPVPPGYAESTLRLLLPISDWVSEGFKWDPPVKQKPSWLTMEQEGK